MHALEQLWLVCSLHLRSIACCACSRIAVVGAAQWCAFHADTAVKRSRAGESGKLESASAGNLAGLLLCTVGQAVLWWHDAHQCMRTEALGPETHVYDHMCAIIKTIHTCCMTPLLSKPHDALSSLHWPPMSVSWSFESSTPGTLPSIHCRRLNLQQPSMRCKDLAFTPSIIQRHVGSLAEVSICHMWLDNVYALSEQPFPWPAPHGKPLLLSAFACKLSRPRSIYTHTHTPHSKAYNTVKHVLQQLYLSCSGC